MILNFISSLQHRTTFQQGLANVDRPLFLLFAAWIVSLVSLPIAKFFWEAPAVTWGISLSVSLQVALVLAILQRAWGVMRTVRVALTVALLGLIVEASGTATGLPFGRYEYTDALQPQVAHVPLLIPLAWLMMLPPAWAIARRITGSGARWSFISLSALAMAAWDLFLDPQLVAWGFWVWAEPGGYFGIPWSNFAGWILTAALMTALVRPGRLPEPPLLAIYLVTWILETIGLLLFWDLPGPALVGFVGMGGLVCLAIRLGGPKRNSLKP